MQTHEDADSKRNANEFMDILSRRADAMKKAGSAKITAGADGETPLGEWELKGFSIRKMPRDSQGILRISIGGGETTVPVNYITYRGDRDACIDLLRKALQALYEIDK